MNYLPYSNHKQQFLGAISLLQKQYKNSNWMDLAGIVKIYDDLFISDSSGARDEQFILLNHVHLVVNLTENYIPNYYQHYDIKYLNPTQITTLEHYEQICEQIYEVTEHPDAVLIHGNDSIEHSLLIAGIFMMRRFRWSLYKTIEYLQARVRGMVLKEDVYEVMKKVQLDLLNNQVKLSYNWTAKGLVDKELMLRNTYLNACGKMDAKQDKIDMFKNSIKKKNKRVTFKIQGQLLARQVSSQQLLRQNSQSNIRNKIILSVRKILNESNKKSSSSLKPTIPESKYEHCDSLLSLKKHKSSYNLTSLKSLDFGRNCTKHQGQPRKDSFRLQTEKSSQVEDQSVLPQSSNKKEKMKTEGQQFRGKMVIDVRVPKSEVTSSCISLVRSLQQKQNLIPKKVKITRKPTPSRVAQILARR